MSESPVTSTNPQPSRAESSRDRWIGLGLIAVSFVVALVLSWLAKEAATPRVAGAPAAATSEGIAGFPNSVKPLELLPRARSLTERDQLVGIALSGVRSDGAMDVTQQGSARFVFRSLEGQGPEPEREYGTLAPRKYCGFQVISVTNAGLGASPDVADADCRRAIAPLPEPGCTLDGIWSLAEKKGADKTQPAVIDYYRSVEGPAWYFQSGAVTLWLDENCASEIGEERGRAVSGRRVPG